MLVLVVARILVFIKESELRETHPRGRRWTFGCRRTGGGLVYCCHQQGGGWYVYFAQSNGELRGGRFSLGSCCASCCCGGWMGNLSDCSTWISCWIWRMLKGTRKLLTLLVGMQLLLCSSGEQRTSWGRLLVLSKAEGEESWVGVDFGLL